MRDVGIILFIDGTVQVFIRNIWPVRDTLMVCSHKHGWLCHLYGGGDAAESGSSSSSEDIKHVLTHTYIHWIGFNYSSQPFPLPPQYFGLSRGINSGLSSQLSILTHREIEAAFVTPATAACCWHFVSPFKRSTLPFRLVTLVIHTCNAAGTDIMKPIS